MLCVRSKYLIRNNDGVKVTLKITGAVISMLVISFKCEKLYYCSGMTGVKSLAVKKAIARVRLGSLQRYTPK